MSLPNFIIIGAAKAGTTALYWYLAEHPEIFMSRVKETNFFAWQPNDYGEPVYGDPRLHHFPVRSWQHYQSLFDDAGGARARGEASPIYLECPDSPSRIRAVIPEARILCGLRNPVDRAYSDYQMFLRGQGRRLEPQRDLAPDAEWLQPDSHWMRTSCYYPALKRYIQEFPREQIHLFLFDELKRDAVAVARKAYHFLDVDSSFTPSLDTPYNVGGIPSNMLLERVFHSAAAVRTVVEPWLPRRATGWLRQLRAANMEKAPALPDTLRMNMMAFFREDIERTSELTGLDLDAWMMPVLKQSA